MNPGLVERLLADRIGLDKASVGGNLIESAVKARMKALGLQVRSTYERALIETDELQALIEEVVVPESWFLRDARPFEILARYARDGWLDRPDRSPFRALSLPCAGGEEPYSIAITLIEAGLGPDRFRVDAVDVSARSLSRAIAAVYGPNAFRGTPDDFRTRHFRAEKGRFILDGSVRKAVGFQVGNILDPSLLADRMPFDAVFCRNLLIYFDEGAKARAFRTLERLTRPGGLLFLGHADRRDPPEGSPFRSIDEKGAFAYLKEGGDAPSAWPAAATATAPVGPPAPIATPGARPRREAPLEATRTARDRPGPSGIGIGPDRPDPPAPGPPARTSPAPDPGGDPIERASALADLGRYDEAEVIVERALAAGASDPRAHFLHGLIRQAAGDRAGAELEFQRAVYLDPNHDEALTALALLARRRGDIAAEAGFRNRAERVLRRKGAMS